MDMAMRRFGRAEPIIRIKHWPRRAAAFIALNAAQIAKLIEFAPINNNFAAGRGLTPPDRAAGNKWASYLLRSLAVAGKQGGNQATDLQILITRRASARSDFLCPRSQTTRDYIGLFDEPDQRIRRGQGSSDITERFTDARYRTKTFKRGPELRRAADEFGRHVVQLVRCLLTELPIRLLRNARAPVRDAA